MAVLTVCMMIETVITVGGECLKGVDKGMKASRGEGDGGERETFITASATRALRRFEEGGCGGQVGKVEGRRGGFRV